MEKALVSIIMPAYNVASFISEAIHSVIAQNYENWELLIINDGSTDNTAIEINKFADKRIKSFHQENKGVSAARNVGLSQMQGEYFCFLDADDRFFKESISARIEKFRSDQELKFVDGVVIKKNENLEKTISKWVPTFQGEPVRDLISLTGNSFFGPSWMIKRDRSQHYSMKEGLTHGEDLLFYILIALNGGNYGFVDIPVLVYRVHGKSAMQNLKKLEIGYINLYQELSLHKMINVSDLDFFRRKTKKIMFKSYLSKWMIFDAIKSLL